MKAISCIIVDDEPLAVKLMESYATKTPFLSLQESFTSGTTAYSFLQDTPVDLLFCDIQMPNLSGMELSKMLPPRTRIIFTTAFSEYAVEGFRVRALDYLLKPISYDDFLAAALKAKEYFELIDRQSPSPVAEPVVRHCSPTIEAPGEDILKGEVVSTRLSVASTSSATEVASSATEVTGSATEKTGSTATVRSSASRPKSIFVKTEYRLQQIDLDKITYVEGLKDYVKIHLTGDSSPILSLMRMKTLEDTLPASDFVRVHKSFIVRLDKIEAIERNHILITTARIPIGDSYQSPLFSALSGASIIPPK